MAPKVPGSSPGSCTIETKAKFALKRPRESGAFWVLGVMRMPPFTCVNVRGYRKAANKIRRGLAKCGLRRNHPSIRPNISIDLRARPDHNAHFCVLSWSHPANRYSGRRQKNSIADKLNLYNLRAEFKMRWNVMIGEIRRGFFDFLELR